MYRGRFFEKKKLKKLMCCVTLKSVAQQLRLAGFAEQILVDGFNVTAKLCRIGEIMGEKEINDIDEFSVIYTYSSCMLEGIKVTTDVIKQLGLGKFPETNEERIALGNLNAFFYVEHLIKDRQDITEDVIKEIHKIIYGESTTSGEYRNTEFYVRNLSYQAPDSNEVEHLMQHFIQQMNLSKKMFNSVEFAAMSHKRILDIQPFNKGNGYVARLLLNLILGQEGCNMMIIPPEVKDKYIQAIKNTQKPMTPDIDTLFELVMNCYLETDQYVKERNKKC